MCRVFCVFYTINVDIQVFRIGFGCLLKTIEILNSYAILTPIAYAFVLYQLNP